MVAKDPCEATITKRLAWPVKQLVVSSHEFSFIVFRLFCLHYFKKLFSKSFYHFSIGVFISLLVHLCFHLLLSFILFLKSFSKTSSYFYFLVFFYQFTITFYLFIISSFLSPSPSITSEFLFFSFSNFLTKKTC